MKQRSLATARIPQQQPMFTRINSEILERNFFIKIVAVPKPFYINHMLFNRLQPNSFGTK